LFADLYIGSDVDGIEPDLPPSLEGRRAELLSEMSQAGVNYYTGKQEFLEQSRGDPPDVYEVVPVEKENRRYDLLGLDEGDVAHYWRGSEDRVEVKRFPYTLEGSLDLDSERSEMFGFLPGVKLRRYVEDRNWELLREPDYEELYDVESGGVSVDVEGTEQAGFDQF